jgi:regulatory protein
MADGAYQAALRMLARRDHFRAELADKLHRRGFSSAEVETALERCAALGLVDDEGLARRFAEVRGTENGWGSRRIEAELRRRGVDRAAAEGASRLDHTRLRAALATALRRAELRAPASWWRLPERRARMVSSLLARGFEADDAIAAVRELAASREIQDDALDDESGDPFGVP